MSLASRIRSHWSLSALTLRARNRSSHPSAGTVAPATVMGRERLRRRSSGGAYEYPAWTSRVWTSTVDPNGPTDRPNVYSPWTDKYRDCWTSLRLRSLNPSARSEASTRPKSSRRTSRSLSTNGRLARPP